MGTGKPQKFFSMNIIFSNEIIPNEDYPDYCIEASYSMFFLSDFSFKPFY